jgi:diketogulonate reductase-like aldo/keto reductase
MANIPDIQLNNGVPMPQLGLGVWRTSDQEAERAVAAALENGYRLIDTAAMYGNEAGVGRAIAASGLPRKDVFVTTKLWNTEHGYDEALRAFDKSLEALGLDYVDLYLIHWPMPRLNKYHEAWQAFEKLYDEGRVRAIGVSNFLPEHLHSLLERTRITPAVNQVELHPYLQQHAIRDVCAAHNIRVEAWSPLGGGKGQLLSDPVIASIAREHHKTPAQVIIRWHLQQGLIVIPKSVHESRIRENCDVLDFELSRHDLEALAQLERGARVGPDPATANFT